MSRLPEDLEEAIRVWDYARHRYIGRQVRYIGAQRDTDWPSYGELGVIVDLEAVTNHQQCPFIVSWPSVTFNIQPTLDSIELVPII